MPPEQVNQHCRQCKQVQQYLPRKVAEVTVRRARNQLASNLAELFDTIAEGNDLCRTDECEVQWVEEEHQVLALVVGQRDLLELSVHDSRSAEGWRSNSQLWNIHL